MSLTNDDGEDGNEHVVAVYDDTHGWGGALGVELDFTLVGSDPNTNQSLIQETITLTNNCPTMDLHFFQYCDLDLGGSPPYTDYKAEIVDGNKAWQWDTDELLTLACESVVSPDPAHYEVNDYPDIRNKLTDGSPTTLADIAGPIYNDDMTWAFQWDFTIPPNDSVTIYKEKMIIPEPGSLSLLCLVAMAGVLRRKGPSR